MESIKERTYVQHQLFILQQLTLIQVTTRFFTNSKMQQLHSEQNTVCCQAEVYSDLNNGYLHPSLGGRNTCPWLGWNIAVEAKLHPERPKHYLSYFCYLTTCLWSLKKRMKVEDLLILPCSSDQHSQWSNSLLTACLGVINYLKPF